MVTTLYAAEPAYYVVGTCGNAGWAADANAENTAYMMQPQDDAPTSWTSPSRTPR